MGEGSAVDVCVAVEGIDSVEVECAGGRAFVRSAVPVGLMTVAGVDVQAERRIRAAMIDRFIASNYMSFHVAFAKALRPQSSAHTARLHSPGGWRAPSANLPQPHSCSPGDTTPSRARAMFPLTFPYAGARNW